MQYTLYCRQYISVRLLSCHRHKSTGHVFPWRRILSWRRNFIILYQDKTWLSSTSRTFTSFLEQISNDCISPVSLLWFQRLAPNLKTNQTKQKHSGKRKWSPHKNFTNTKSYRRLFFDIFFKIYLVNLLVYYFDCIGSLLLCVGFL